MFFGIRQCEIFVVSDDEEWLFDPLSLQDPTGCGKFETSSTFTDCVRFSDCGIPSKYSEEQPMHMQGR